jgi:hypothetical protein
LRLIFQRATALRVNGTQWRVLTAVLALTATYSKQFDETYVARIAELADLDHDDPSLKRTKRALKVLSQQNLIIYRPAVRHGQGTVIGLPPKEKLSLAGGSR